MQADRKGCGQPFPLWQNRAWYIAAPHGIVHAVPLRPHRTGMKTFVKGHIFIFRRSVRFWYNWSFICSAVTTLLPPLSSRPNQAYRPREAEHRAFHGAPCGHRDFVVQRVPGDRAARPGLCRSALLYLRPRCPGQAEQADTPSLLPATSHRDDVCRGGPLDRSWAGGWMGGWVGRSVGTWMCVGGWGNAGVDG